MAAAKKKTAKKKAPAKPKLLSGGNPQIAKGYGDEVVQSYIAAITLGDLRITTGQALHHGAAIAQAQPST